MLSMALLILVGCIKGKKVHCKDHISEIPYYVVFVGFKPEVLDTILVYQYSDNGRDTNYYVVDTSLTVINDTSSPVLYFYPGWQYRITFSESPAVFELKNPQYPKGREFEAIGDCTSARSNVSTPESITVNGQSQDFFILNTNRAVVYLK